MKQITEFIKDEFNKTKEKFKSRGTEWMYGYTVALTTFVGILSINENRILELATKRYLEKRIAEMKDSAQDLGDVIGELLKEADKLALSGKVKAAEKYEWENIRGKQSDMIDLVKDIANLENMLESLPEAAQPAQTEDES